MTMTKSLSPPRPAVSDLAMVEKRHDALTRLRAATPFCTSARRALEVDQVNPDRTDATNHGETFEPGD